MSVLFFILFLPVNDFKLIGDSTYHYVFYALWFALLLYLFVRYQRRSLMHARRLLKEKELAFNEIERQRQELELKNRDITDSLVYASYIQQSMLPSELYFNKVLKDAFVLFRPREIVSGDFYWVRRSHDKIFVVAADCTGHGVPGAFMSMIGVELLNKIIIDQKIQKASEILYIMSKGIERTFSRGEEGSSTMKDGMDMGLCIIDTRKRTLDYSGAFFPLYVIRDKRIIEIKGDRLSIGLDTDSSFTSSSLELHDEDVIYMFSDGYTDQFGGPNNKKFMYRRFRHLLLTIHNFPMAEQKNILKESIIAWQRDNDQVDDQMVLGFRPMIGIKTPW
ncbi:MAG: SpoIIE family protein phosphatase [Marinilabiliaceae bacterium]|nr:SpoIIE family protein phosphatase [Marinilabiliaceae bacterium]